MRRSRFHVLAFLALWSAGCRSGPFDTAPVSGRVTLNGKPLAGAAVMFQPVAKGNHNPGPGSTGLTDEDGRYTLTVVGTGSKGAVVGMHKVRITMFQKDDSADDQPKPVEQLPARYRQKDTVLECDVPADGTTSADFVLTAP
jgi:hypothetical protein